MGKKKEKTPFHEKIVMGVELEGYTILIPRHEISRKMAFRRKGVGEKGERFTRDWSIGTEYNSRPFSTIREGLFLLKTGLRKYNSRLYRSQSKSNQSRQIFLVGGWRDRFAGTHVHLSVAGHKFSMTETQKLASYIHDHLPLLIAMGANSPVWSDEITENASNRVLKGSKIYFRPITRRGLKCQEFDEMTFNKGRKLKPATLEIRVMDSNIPEYVLATACVIKACSLVWLRRKKPVNQLTHFQYMRSRLEAAKRGMKARLCWNGKWMSAAEYLDRFVWAHRSELKAMDVPQEIWSTLKLLKKGINGSWILHKAASKAYAEHPQTWQKRFAKNYVKAVDHLLSGNSLLSFIKILGLKTPSISNVWLGRERLKLL